MIFLIDQKSSVLLIDCSRAKWRLMRSRDLDKVPNSTVSTLLDNPDVTDTYYAGSELRIAIIHARWNTTVISALISGAKKSLLAAGVQEQNIVIESVPGSYELPYAVQKVYAASVVHAPKARRSVPAEYRSGTPLSQAFDAVIAIGVLIKGETMHFEYIADAVSHGLMKLQLESEFPIIFGLLTVLTEDQAKARAGIDGMGHNHGEDWGNAAVELGVKRIAWAEGKLSGI